ncbi:hypothetical protein PIB30_047201 [Stylosanthes scabra]|uniref:Uncharacterized protein n=1 Tax=Stylosanthes scabra TaxID=79078 RepID=A0ABU6TGD8_9FABA|nr:hypothetical protein [Stylosanthes scabra]
MAHKLVNYSHGKEEFVASKSDFAITSKNINQMRRDLANPDAAEGDVLERNVRPRVDSVGEVLPTTEPTTEVPAADPPVTDEVTRTNDPAAEDVTEVAPTVADQGEGVQTATETTEVVQVAVDTAEGVQVVADSVETVQEQTVETPVQD